MLELVRVNRMDACYIRPIVFRGYGDIGVNAAEEPDRHLHRLLGMGQVSGRGGAGRRRGRVRLELEPHGAEHAAGAGQGRRELHELAADPDGGAPNGYSEGIALDTAGYVSEGSGENIFVVRDGKILTPPLGASVLPGITRDTVLKLARELGIPMVETIIPREMLYIADEVFFTGTAAEITPIRSIDRIKIGKGRRGPSRRRCRRSSSESSTGRRPDRHGWLSPVQPRQAVVDGSQRREQLRDLDGHLPRDLPSDRAAA